MSSMYREKLLLANESTLGRINSMDIGFLEPRGPSKANMWYPFQKKEKKKKRLICGIGLTIKKYSKILKHMYVYIIYFNHLWLNDLARN